MPECWELCGGALQHQFGIPMRMSWVIYPAGVCPLIPVACHVGDSFKHDPSRKTHPKTPKKLHINFIACSPALYKRISGLEDVWSRIKHYFQLPTFRVETWWKTYPPGKLHNHLLQDLGHGIVYKMMPSGGEIHIVTCQNSDAQINSGNIINYNKYFIIPIFIFICMG